MKEYWQKRCKRKNKKMLKKIQSGIYPEKYKLEYKKISRYRRAILPGLQDYECWETIFLNRNNKNFNEKYNKNNYKEIHKKDIHNSYLLQLWEKLEQWLYCQIKMTIEFCESKEIEAYYLLYDKIIDNRLKYYNEIMQDIKRCRDLKYKDKEINRKTIHEKIQTFKVYNTLYIKMKFINKFERGYL